MFFLIKATKNDKLLIEFNKYLENTLQYLREHVDEVNLGVQESHKRGDKIEARLIKSEYDLHDTTINQAHLFKKLFKKASRIEQLIISKPRLFGFILLIFGHYAIASVSSHSSDSGGIK